MGISVQSIIVRTLPFQTLKHSGRSSCTTSADGQTISPCNSLFNKFTHVENILDTEHSLIPNCEAKKASVQLSFSLIKHKRSSFSGDIFLAGPGRFFLFIWYCFVFPASEDPLQYCICSAASETRLYTYLKWPYVFRPVCRLTSSSLCLNLSMDTTLASPSSRCRDITVFFRETISFFIATLSSDRRWIAVLLPETFCERVFIVSVKDLHFFSFSTHCFFLHCFEIIDTHAFWCSFSCSCTTGLLNHVNLP